MPYTEAQQIPASPAVETRAQRMSDGDVHRDGSERLLRQTRDHQRPDSKALPCQKHSDAGVPEDIPACIEYDVQAKTQLPSQERLGDGVQAVERKKERH